MIELGELKACIMDYTGNKPKPTFEVLSSVERTFPRADRFAIRVAYWDLVDSGELVRVPEGVRHYREGDLLY